MPTETWRNLPPAKRARISEVAMREFGAKGFSAGSLNVIAREAGIAKGSLFQYFDDKLDLFATVCDIGSAAIEAATVGMLDADQPFFELLHHIVDRWLVYFRTHPVELGMAFAAANEVDRAARVAVRGVTNRHFASALRPLVATAIARGEIARHHDPALVVSSCALVLRHLNSAPFDPVGDPAIPFTELADDEVDARAHDYVEVLARAFGP